MLISAIVIVYNEFFRINTCLASLYGQVDEIVLIDDGSDDHRLELRCLYRYWKEIYESIGVNMNVLLEDHKGNHGKYLSMAYKHVTSDWILQLDGDEVLVIAGPGMLNGIVIPNEALGHVGFRCNLINFQQTKNEFMVGLFEPKVRLYKKDSGYYPDMYAVEWKFNSGNPSIVDATKMFHINHIRTAKEQNIDRMEYFRKFVEGYKDAGTLEEKKYYKDSFKWVGEQCHWQYRDIEEVIAKGVEECLQSLMK